MARTLAPPPKQTVSEWADAERRLSQESSAEHGKWRTDRAPYQREILDAFSDPSVEIVVGKTSAQIGKTEIILNVLAFHIDKDPGPILLVQPTLQLAEDFSKDRIAPMLRDTPALRGKIKDATSRDSDNTLLHKKFNGGYIALAGGNSSASLAGRPIRICLIDEVDRLPKSAGTEGDPVNLAIKRTTAFYNKKIGVFSTPTIKGDSRIDDLYEKSDQRKRYVPCPHCGHKQTLVFDNLKWDKGDTIHFNSIHYECAECREPIYENEKNLMDLKGEWIAHAEFNGIAGFHINELYSPWVRWKDIAKAFLAAKDNPEQLKTFVNTSLGETFEIRGEAPKWKELYDKRENYPIRVVPPQACLLTGSIDVQKDRIECQVVAWRRDKQNWVVEHRVILGATEKEETWAKLDEFVREEYPHAKTGVLMPVRVFAIDSGYNTSRVYNWARKYPASKIMVIKGQASIPMIVGKPLAADVTSQGKRVARGLKVWPIGVSKAKEDLYTWLRLEKPVDGQPFPPCYCHFPEFDQEFFEQLTAEDLVKKIVKGFARYEWVKRRERNEALDLWVYARAAASFAGMDRMQQHHWAALEASVGVNIKEEKPQEIVMPENIQNATQAPPPPATSIFNRERRKSTWL